ncbi:MAG TPA: glycosyltransferase [Flavitalea sp.]|nr:glycosyltransferase [Flavitalea sp.]
MNTRKPVVLLAPLDWGLGHSIRCIPIINELLKRNCEVLVACNPKQKQVLSVEFPSIQFIHLTGYDISYGHNRLATLLRFIRQTPKILMAIKREQIWLKEFLKTNRVDAVISDNRYGLYSKLVPSVFITHQLGVRSGLGRMVDFAIQKKLYSFINKFSSCWVPDSADLTMNAAGKLSHPDQLPNTAVEYIGCLSRLEKCHEYSTQNDLLIILSGPEPQRTILENILLRELKTFYGAGVMVRGIIDSNPIGSFNKTTVINYASSNELNKLICKAGVVICRSGYTSVMDLLALGKKSILIPTPGQAEQEYLAKHLRQKNLAIVAKQEGLCLKTELESAIKSTINVVSDSRDKYKTAVSALVESLKNEKHN